VLIVQHLMLVVLVFFPHFSSFFVRVVLFSPLIHLLRSLAVRFQTSELSCCSEWEQTTSAVDLLVFHVEVIDAFRSRTTSPALSTFSVHARDASRRRGE
jgi:hypothetical protein